jgi:hypothetical protein
MFLVRNRQADLFCSSDVIDKTTLSVPGANDVGFVE